MTTLVAAGHTVSHDDFRLTTSHLPIYFYLFSFAGPFQWRSWYTHPIVQWLIALSCTLASAVAVPVLDLLYGIWTQDITAVDASPSDIRASSDRAGYIMFAVGVAQLLLFWGAMYLFMRSSEKLTDRLRISYVSSLLAKDVDYFAHHGAGELSSRIGPDIEAIRVGFGEKMAYAGQCLGIVLASTTLGFVKSARVAGVLFPIIPLVMGIFALLGYASDRISSPASRLEGQVATFMEQMLNSPRIIHAFDATKTLLRKLDQAFLFPLAKWNKRRAMIRAVELSSVYAVMMWLYGSFSAWGANQISGEHVTVGPAVTAFWSFVNTFFSISNLVPHLASIYQAFSSLQALRKTIEELPAIDPRSKDGLQIPSTVVPSFRVEGVTFAYPSRPTLAALSDITLDIEPNKVTAFVGPSGCGKSTLMALLLREFDAEYKTGVPAPTAIGLKSEPRGLDIEEKAPLIHNRGKITYGGHDIRDINLASYRSEIGLVAQNPQLFTGSVLDNVAAGLTETQSKTIVGEALRERAREALIKAQAWEFVSALPQGMDTLLRGGHSNMLSGGQRQRLALARALIRKPTVLLLDEATSALDSNTEGSIRISLEAEQRERNMTCCIVAHRLSTIRHADKIVVFSGGRIVDSGTHEELMQLDRRDSTYRSMVMKTMMLEEAQEDDQISTVVEKSPLPISSSTPQVVPTSEPPSPPSSHRHEVIDSGTAASEKGAAAETMAKLTDLDSSTSKSLKYLLARTRNRRLVLVIGSAAAVVASTTFPASGYVTGRAIAALSSADLDAVRRDGYFWALIFLVLGLANLFLYTMQGYFLDEASSFVGTVLKRDSLESLMGQNMAYFDLSTNLDDKGESNTVLGSAASLSQHPSNIATGISAGFGQSILCVGNILVSFGICIGLSYKMTLVTYAPLLLLPFLGYITIVRLESAGDEHTARAERCAKYLSEQVDGIRTINALGRQRSVLARFKEMASTVGTASGRKSLLIGTLALAGGQSWLFMPSALAFWFAGVLLAQRDISISSVYAVFEIQIIAGFAVSRFVALVPDIARAVASTKIVCHWLSMTTAEEAAVDEKPKVADDGFHVGDIAFEDVVLYYPQRPDYPALRGVSLNIPRESTCALVGTSGSGKSTLLSLLSSFYDPSSGRVLLDGRDMRTLDVKMVRSRCALVSQDAVLFQGTIRENVALGAVVEGQASEESIRFACEQAGVLDFVQSLPEGFDTEIGLKGMELSGGQRQRLCIARALLRSPEVLLLDETTSALDAESEAIVQASLERASKGRTTIIVAHRLSTIRYADCIYVFEDGKVVESGTHEQLVKARGRYLELIEAQL